MDTTFNVFQKLNSPLQFIDRIDDVELWMKREDQIHPAVSGNKWRKLKYYLEDFQKSPKNSIATFGGAFSNHIAATAALGKISKLPTLAFVRGEEISSNPTIDFCRNQGMQIIPMSRAKYAKKESADFLENLRGEFPEAYFIPEGGKGSLGVKGCAEITEEIKESFDLVCCSAGTATTATGLIISPFPPPILIYPALKGGSFLKKDIHQYLDEYEKAFLTEDLGKKDSRSFYSLSEDYHFGGYGKVNLGLVDFMNDFYDKYKVPLDPIYTGKMMFGIIKDIKKGKIEKGTKLLAIHTGGLQGISGINQRLKKSGNTLIKYES